MKDRAHDEAMVEVFRKDPDYAAELLNSILEDGDQSELLIALRQMTKAFGGASKVARLQISSQRRFAAKCTPLDSRLRGNDG